MFKERSKCLFISAILSTAYFIYLICYFSGAVFQPGSKTESAVAVLATALVIPHIIAMGVGSTFAWLGFFLKANWSVLVRAILYAVSGRIIYTIYYF